MDGHFNGDYWFYSGFGVLGYPGVCAGVVTGAYWYGFRLFFGFAFGMGGLGAAVLGMVADHTSIFLVYKICAFLPLLGMLTIFLPDNRHKA